MERAYTRRTKKPCPRLLAYTMRWAYVIATWFISILIPFFNDIMGLIGTRLLCVRIHASLPVRCSRDVSACEFV